MRGELGLGLFFFERGCSGGNLGGCFVNESVVDRIFEEGAVGGSRCVSIRKRVGGLPR